MTRDETEGRGAALLGLFALILFIFGLWFFFGCATGQAIRHADGSLTMTAACIGEDAKFTITEPVGEAGILTSAPQRMIECEGGPLIPSLLDGIGKLIWGFLGF